MKRRSFGGCILFPKDPSQQRKVKKGRVAPLAGITGVCGRIEEIHDAISRLLKRSQKGAWYRILPQEFGYDDITAATGCSWEVLPPLLVQAGLLRFVVTSDVKETHVRFTQWEELAKASVLSGEWKMEVSFIRRKGEAKEYFYCIGVPEYRGPQHQIDSLNRRGASVFVWTRLKSTRSSEFQQLFDSCKKLALQIRNHRLVHRLANKGEIEGRDLSEQVVEEMSNLTNKNIQQALLLDLEKRPRISRGSSLGFVKVNPKRVVADERARHMILHTAIMWGWNDPVNTVAMHRKIAKAACRQIAYNFGYP